MLVQEVLAELGGTATRAELLTRVTEHELRQALNGGLVRRPARGRYALPLPTWTQERVVLADLAGAGRRAAHEVTGTAILLTAAAKWGWPMKWVPTKPQIAVPRNRKVPPRVLRSFDVRFRAVPPGDREDGWVTSRVRTALDCASLLPGDEAVAVLDSALRQGAVDRDDLLLAASGLPPRYRRKVENRVGAATSRAANPFESVLRWIVSDIPGLDVEPQTEIRDGAGLIGIVDLADERVKIVLEADSFEWHGSKEALEKDCIRYDRLVAEGWLVLRFSWDRVMHHPDWVRGIVIRTLTQRDSRV
ncbi:DUF559 domain-containing protein [Janibacter corallicola]|uniref:DUF559 domain-containing protein n=1 Tax=Janibacter corallicola TaxID=415212 RepID=UPI00147069CE|nr:DUF559 domain-containing protein [Janibacter corallicola]